LRSRVAGAPVERVELWIVRAGHPRRRAAALPRVVFPRLVPPFPLAGNGVEPPRAPAGFRIVSVDETADAVLAPRHADDHLVFDRERCAGEAITLVRVRRRHIPSDASGPGVERDDVGVERAHEDAITE